MRVSNLVTRSLLHKASNEKSTAHKDLYLGSRSFKMGGTPMPWSPPSINVVEYVSIGIGGSAVDFGDMAKVGRFKQGTCTGYGTRAVSNGGGPGSPPTGGWLPYEYQNLASKSNAIDSFGTEASNMARSLPVSNGYRGFWCGGQQYPSTTISDVIQYLDLQSGGSAVDIGETGFGTGTNAVENTAGGDGSRGMIFFTGFPQQNDIRYFNMGTHGSGAATDWGERTSTSGDNDSAVGSGRYIVFGQYGSAPTIDSGNIMSLASAIDWGDYATKPNGNGFDTDGVRGLCSSGENAQDVLQYISMITRGNSVDFGEPWQPSTYHGGTSGD